MEQWKPGAPNDPPKVDGYSPSSPDGKKRFLEFLEETGLVEEAARLCDITPKSAWRWRVQDEEFAKQWDTIIREKVLPQLEAEAARRAIKGSDLLLIFLMKAYKRDMYDDRFTAKKNGPKRTRIIIEDAVEGTVVADVEEGPDGEARVEREAAGTGGRRSITVLAESGPDDDD